MLVRDYRCLEPLFTPEELLTLLAFQEMEKDSKETM